MHPRLCRKALETKVCTNKRCKFYHVPGTKFLEDAELDSVNSKQYTILKRPVEKTPNEDQFNEVLKRATPRPDKSGNIARQGQNQQNQTGLTACETQASDFLEIKKEIKAMQEQIQLLLTLAKQPLAQITQPSPMMGWFPRH